MFLVIKKVRHAGLKVAHPNEISNYFLKYFLEMVKFIDRNVSFLSEFIDKNWQKVINSKYLHLNGRRHEPDGFSAPRSYPPANLDAGRKH